MDLNSYYRSTSSRNNLKYRKEKPAKETNLNSLANQLKLIGIDNKTISQYRNIASQSELIPHMNMTILAWVFYYMSYQGLLKNTDKISFPNNIMYSNYFNVIIRKYKPNFDSLSEDAQLVIRLRLAATFIRYINFVQNIISSSEIDYNFEDED